MKRPPTSGLSANTAIDYPFIDSSQSPPHSKRSRAGSASSNIANHLGLRRQSHASSALSLVGTARAGPEHLVSVDPGVGSSARCTGGDIAARCPYLGWALLSLVGMARLRRPRRVPAAQREAGFARKA